MEFLVLHSTAFLVGFRLMKGFPTWVFFLIYAPFGLILGASMSSYLATVLFFWHLASGVWGDFDMAERNIGGFLMRYLPSFLWFFMLPFAVVLLKLPALGWDEYPGLAFRTDQGFRSAAQRLSPHGRRCTSRGERAGKWRCGIGSGPGLSTASSRRCSRRKPPTPGSTAMKLAGPVLLSSASLSGDAQSLCAFSYSLCVFTRSVACALSRFLADFMLLARVDAERTFGKESNRLRSLLWQDGHSGSAFPRTNVSNSRPHPSQQYS
jgi:hypothetical protein